MFATIMYVVQKKWIYRFSSIFSVIAWKKIDNYFNLDPFIPLEIWSIVIYFIYSFCFLLCVCVCFFTCCFLWLWKQLCVGVNYTQKLHIMPVVVIFFLLYTHIRMINYIIISIYESYYYDWFILYVHRSIHHWMDKWYKSKLLVKVFSFFSIFSFSPFKVFWTVFFFFLCPVSMSRMMIEKATKTMKKKLWITMKCGKKNFGNQSLLSSIFVCVCVCLVCDRNAIFDFFSVQTK